MFEPSDWICDIFSNDNINEFSNSWLEGVCKWGDIRCGAVFCIQPFAKKSGIVADYPKDADASSYPDWLTGSCLKISKSLPVKPCIYSFQQNIAGSQDVLVVPIPKQVVADSPESKMLVPPVNVDANFFAIICLPNKASERSVLNLTLALCGMFSFKIRNNSTSIYEESSKRFRDVFAIQSKVNANDSFYPAIITLCNEIANTIGAERVALGVCERKFVKIKAIDHTENFEQCMNIGQSISAAMEECMDQGCATFYPANDVVKFSNREAKVLAQKGGASKVIALPIIVSGQPRMVLTIELSNSNDLNTSDLDVIILLLDLLAPTLYSNYLHSQNSLTKVQRFATSKLSWLLGAQHTLWKVGGILAVILIVCSLYFTTFLRIEAPLSLEPNKQLIVSAPFECYLKSVNVKPGDKVIKNETVLGEFDVVEISKEYHAALAEAASHKVRSDLARKEHNEAQAAISRYQSAQATSRAGLLKTRIERSRLIAPVSGCIIGEDMTQRLGMPLKSGDELFVIVDTDGLRAVLQVREDDQPELKIGQVGEFRITANPNELVMFKVERIQPFAEAKDGANVFEVWGEIVDPPHWLRPGMAGEGEVITERVSYASIWTRRISNWVRLKMWEWF